MNAGLERGLGTKSTSLSTATHPPIPHPALVHSPRPSQRLSPHPSLQQDCLYQSDPKSLRWQFYPEFPWQVTISLTLSSAICSNTVHSVLSPLYPPIHLPCTINLVSAVTLTASQIPNAFFLSHNSVFKPPSVQSPPETSNYALTSSTLSVPCVTLLSVPLSPVLSVTSGLPQKPPVCVRSLLPTRPLDKYTCPRHSTSTLQGSQRVV